MAQVQKNNPADLKTVMFKLLLTNDHIQLTRKKNLKKIASMCRKITRRDTAQWEPTTNVRKDYSRKMHEKYLNY